MLRPKVLVVDDQPSNVELISQILGKAGIDTLTASSGTEALGVVAQTQPDLVLLDVQMPDIDGFGVCERLQADESTRHIPVIFVTADDSHSGKIAGLGVGAVDYITKPIEADETLARVQTQLRFVSINREMCDIQHRLDEARRTATIGAVTQGIAHNLNNLLGVALGYLDLVQLHSDNPVQVKKNAQQVEKAVLRIIDIIRQLGKLVAQSRPQFVSSPLDEIIRMAVARYQAAQTITPPVIVENLLGDIQVDTQREMIEEVLLNLLQNAFESYSEKPDAERTVWLRTALLNKPEGRMLEITIEDEGAGINADIRDSIFEPFVGTKTKVGGGMGLTVARHSMRNLGGEVTLVNRAGGGAVAVIIHPLERKKKRGAPTDAVIIPSALIGESDDE
ncbi:MAG: hybrid sensor histidine kinase/response regulator [Opitutus sp.]|nr:hybrid sensor histidine kinase/response regulator [Opitutus sp.]MCS6247852.1 hybrid sensor histidine kinase/response regulator [Opitutus sp.]MCS6274167.1 hybrid sensor histidine kinase/response regulator [Opitutus sp.]MCS6278941.1 hybrid sensor histidine kinase/response regulator [Opitutus sp.]MCS6298691.1 hybrid sensor histidine kinase/response regulator [Opitutus sp.]